MNELDIGSPVFACGHPNPSGNHYCNVCGAERGGRTCSRCRASNRDDANFCGGCGARLATEQAAPEAPVGSPARPGAESRETTYSTMSRGASASPDPPGWEDDDLAYRQASPFNGGGRRADRLFSRVDDVLPEDEDISLADEREIRDGRRKRALLTAVVIVAVVCTVFLAVSQFGLAWRFPERLVNRLVAERSAPPVTRGEPPAEATRATVPSAAPEGKVPAALPEGTPPSAEPRPRPEAQASAAPDDRDSSRPTLPPAARSRRGQVAERAEDTPSGGTGQADTSSGGAAQTDTSSGGAAQTTDPSARTSEERMAAYLVEELGPKPAAATALSNAAWYEAGRSEHAFWQRVAEAIKRREAH